MEKIVEVFRADVVNKNNIYYPLEVLKDFVERNADRKVVVMNSPGSIYCDSSGDDIDFKKVVGVVSDFYIEGDSLYATANIFDDFVDDTLRNFQKNKIPVYLSPGALVSRLDGGRAEGIVSIPDFRLSINPAAKWRKPFLDE